MRAINTIESLILFLAAKNVLINFFYLFMTVTAI